MTDRFTTVKHEARVKITVGSCRFIASVARADSPACAVEFIERVRGEFSGATHNAYAYRIGSGNDTVCKTSDAGEPAGTAGPVMLQAINKAGLTNVAVVGTRYFGGVKLGVGGLIRAYRSCAEAGLAAAGRVTETAMLQFKVKVSYEYFGAVIGEITASGGTVDGVEYTEQGTLVNGWVPRNHAQTVAGRLVDFTRGKAEVSIGDTSL